jgi:hypothetical protein
MCLQGGHVTAMEERDPSPNRPQSAPEGHNADKTASSNAICTITNMLESTAVQAAAASLPKAVAPDVSNAGHLPKAEFVKAKAALLSCVNQLQSPCPVPRNMQEILKDEERLDELHDAVLHVLLLVRKRRKELHSNAVAAVAGTSAALTSKAHVQKKGSNIAAGVAANGTAGSGPPSWPSAGAQDISSVLAAAAAAAAAPPGQQATLMKVTQQLTRSLHSSHPLHADALPASNILQHTSHPQAQPELQDQPSPSAPLPPQPPTSLQKFGPTSDLLAKQHPQSRPLKSLEEISLYSMPSSTPDNSDPINVRVLSAADEAPPATSPAASHPSHANWKFDLTANAQRRKHTAPPPNDVPHWAPVGAPRDSAAGSGMLTNGNHVLRMLAAAAAQTLRAGGNKGVNGS